MGKREMKKNTHGSFFLCEKKTQNTNINGFTHAIDHNVKKFVHTQIISKDITNTQSMCIDFS